MIIKKAKRLTGTITVPGDKSISHRAIMFGSLANGTTEITNFLQGADCLSTIDCFSKMGVRIEQTPEKILVHGNGLHGLTRPNDILDVGNSGTTTRLMSGILAGQPFPSVVTGDASICKRPMNRIITPLRMMGAHIESKNNSNCTPLTIYGAPLHGITYQSPVASAQVKSCILLAGLYADGNTSVTEPFLSRNHTELMLKQFGAPIKSEGVTASISPCDQLNAQRIHVPADISSAAYFIVAALITPNSELCIQNVGINPTRDGILKVVKEMGGNVILENKKETDGEPTADLIIKTSELTGTTIGGSLIPTLIDEIPVLSVLACFASGTTIIKDAKELKVKESNRIDVMVSNLKKLGANIEATEDGMIIKGGTPLHGAEIDPHLDHRIAMSFAIAGLNTESPITIKNPECVDISFPNFYSLLSQIQQS